MRTFEEALRQLWPHGNRKVPGLIEGIAAAAPRVFRQYGFRTAVEVAHAMAQFSHECGAGLEMVENLNYSETRLPQVWPKHFNSSNAYRYAHNPKKLANYIYEPPCHKDLGNRAGTDDGWNYRGRGLPQCTGRDGYAHLQDTTHLPLLTNPGLLCDPKTALECGVADFVNCGCLPYAKQDNIKMVTRKLNGGYIGLSERRQWLKKWKKALADVALPLHEPPKQQQVVPAYTRKVPETMPVPPSPVKNSHIATAAVATAGVAWQFVDYWPYILGVGVLAIAGLILYKVLRK